MVGWLPPTGGVFTAPGLSCVSGAGASVPPVPLCSRSRVQRSCSAEEHAGSGLPCVALTDAACPL